LFTPDIRLTEHICSLQILDLPNTFVHPRFIFGEVHVANLFSFLCCVLFILFCLSSFCVWCPMLPVYLDCSFLIVPSVSLTFIYLDIEIRSTRVILTLPYLLSLMRLVCISGSFVLSCLYIRTINRVLVCIFESSICFLLSVYPDHQLHPFLYIRITHLFLAVSISGSLCCSLFQYQDRQCVLYCLYIRIFNLFLFVCISRSSFFVPCCLHI
jgi:hypothetical protein